MDHVPGPWAIAATVASGTGAVALADAILGASGPIAFGVGSILAGVAGLIWQCVRRLDLQRRIAEREAGLTDERDAA